MDEEQYSDYDWYQDQGYFDDYSDYDWYSDQGYFEEEYSNEYSDYDWYEDQGYFDQGYGDYSDYSDYADWTDQGYQYLGDGVWLDPIDGATYDESTGDWTLEDGTIESGWGESDTFVDPIMGITFYGDGSYLLPDGTMVDADGNITFEDGTSLSDDQYTDANGDVWESMAWSGAPQVWQNLSTGDTWNMNSGTYVPAQFVESVSSGDRITYDQFLQQQKTENPANYARLTQPTSTPGASSIGGGSGGGSGINLGGGSGGSQPKATGSTGGITLDSLNQLLKTATVATQAVASAKSAGASTSQIAALQRQAQQAAQAVVQAKAAGIATGDTASSISNFLKNNAPLLIAAAGITAVLLFTPRRAPTPQSNALPAA